MKYYKSINGLKAAQVPIEIFPLNVLINVNNNLYNRGNAKISHGIKLNNFSSLSILDSINVNF